MGLWNTTISRTFFYLQDKVHIPGAIYLSVKFDSQCNTEEGCDELIIASSCDFIHDRHTFSGPPHKWTDFELPGKLQNNYPLFARNNRITKLEDTLEVF